MTPDLIGGRGICLSLMFLHPRHKHLSVMGTSSPFCPLHLSLTESGRFVRREGHRGYEQVLGYNTLIYERLGVGGRVAGSYLWMLQTH